MFKRYISIYSNGPHGVGDPDDKSLRKIERDIMIPTIRRRIVREQFCNKEIDEYEKCGLSHGLISMSYYCKDLKHKLAECLDYWNDTEETQKLAYDEFMEEREIYRRTGKCKEERDFEAAQMEKEKKERQERQHFQPEQLSKNQLKN